MLALMQKQGYAPRFAVFEITLRCNLDCRHCGSRAGNARDDELTLEEIRVLARDLGRLGCRHLTLSGGEPLMRRDWPEIAEAMREAKITTALISNGSIWSSTIAERFKSAGIASLGISVDGFSANHDYQRRSPGLFKRAVETITQAADAGIEVVAVTTVNRRNKSELPELRDFLGECGARFHQFQLATPTGNMTEHPDLMLEPKDVLEIVPLLAQLRQDEKTPRVQITHTIGYFGEPEPHLRDGSSLVPFWTGCPAGMSVIGIESNGNVKGCLSLPSEKNCESAFLEGNVRTESLPTIWNRPGGFAYNREFSLELLGGECRTCDYAEVCRGGCTWRCTATTGFVRDNEYCFLRQERRVEAEARRRLPLVDRRGGGVG